jgi:hypothetical protein
MAWHSLPPSQGLVPHKDGEKGLEQVVSSPPPSRNFDGASFALAKYPESFPVEIEALPDGFNLITKLHRGKFGLYSFMSSIIRFRHPV